MNIFIEQNGKIMFENDKNKHKIGNFKIIESP